MKERIFPLSLLLALGLLLGWAPSTFAQATASASGTASASASAKARVTRAASLSNGQKLTVKKSAKASYRGETKAQLQARKKGQVALRERAAATLAAKKNVRVKASKSYSVKKKARVSAQSSLSASTKARVKAEADLEIAVKARASAQGELKVAKKKKAAYEAKASGGFRIDLSFGTKQKKLTKKVTKAEDKVKTAKSEEKKAKKKVAAAKTEEAAATDKVTAAKSDEKKAKKKETVAKADESDAQKELAQVDEDIAETDEAIAETAEEETEEVVVEPAPSTPSDNVFGYDEPVWGCFEGEVMFIEENSDKLPTDYSKYEVSSRLYACEWNIPVRSFSQGFPGVADKYEWFAIKYSGMFRLTAAGTYKFRINSDDGTKLYIDGQPVVMNDGAHPQQSVEGSIELDAGDHDLVLEYFQGPRYEIALQVWVTPPGGTEEIFSVRESE